jgi:hypothetical protein
MHSRCFCLGQSNFHPMIRIAAKASSSYNRAKPLDGRDRFPGCRYAEDKLNTCILPTISQLVLHRLPNCLIYKAQEIAVPGKVNMESINRNLIYHLPFFDFLDGCWAYAMVFGVFQQSSKLVFIQICLEPLLTFLVPTILLVRVFGVEAPR